MPRCSVAPPLRRIIAPSLPVFQAFASCSARVTGRTAVVEELLRAHARLDVANRAGAHPLSLACAFDHLDVVKLLLRAGAKDGAASGRDALELARDRDCSAAVCAAIAASQAS